MIDQEHIYCRACRLSVKYFRRLLGDLEAYRRKSQKTVSKEFLDAIDISGFELEAWEVHLLSYTSGLFFFFSLATLDIIFLSVSTYERNTIIFSAVFTVIIPFVVMIYVSEYPKIHAKFLKIHTLGDIPEIQSYIVMSMKLVPNMERAIIFAAENSFRPLARDLKKLIWDIHIRTFSSIDDALIAFSNQWGKNSEYFKRSIHLVKSSTSEPDEAQRIMTLNKSLDIVLEGTENMMDAFAAKLKTPTYVLFSIFILIPLALVALIPAVSIVGIRIDTLTLVLIYNIGLPVFTFFYSEFILMQRPATFSPPKISARHPDLSNISSIRKKTIIFALAAGTLVGFSGYLLLYYSNPFNIISKEAMGGLILPTFPVVWAVAVMITIYCLGIYIPYKKIRDDIKQIESEFADAMFILGRRISEGRSAEEAFMHTSETMKGSKIGDAFADISKNLSSMRTTLHGSIFNEEYGAFRDIYSDRVHTIMKLLTESVHRSHEAAGMAIIKLADHLKELQDVETNIIRTLFDVTSTMRSTAIIFAPLIAGVTLALSEVIQKILLNISKESRNLPDEYNIGDFMTEAGTGMTQSVPPDIFLLVVGTYMILLVIILTRFAGGIEYGDDRPQFMYDLGQTLPMSIMTFTVTTIVSRVIFGSMI